MRFVRISTLTLLVLTVTGCCSVVSKSGDAKILRCPQFIHTRGSKLFRMALPKVSIGQAGTNVLHVRNLPPYLKGLFRYDFELIMPYGGPDADEAAPWYDAKISIAFRKLDGTEVFAQSFHLGTAPHGSSQAHDGWVVGWNLGEVPVQDESFDIIVTIEQPSRRALDHIWMRAYAIYLPKP